MATLDVDDTIVAIASPPGGSQRGILRVSGPAMAGCVDGAFRAESGIPISQIKSVAAIAGTLKLEGDLTLPGKLLVWPTTKSYTRQPSAEFHTIGSPPLLQMGLASICRAGARAAGPGEFTLRAFLSGRIDLTQAEAVMSVIDAKGQHDLRRSLDQLAGNLADPLTSIRNNLISILAELEAQLDFVEEDIEFISNDHLLGQLDSAQRALRAITDQIRQRSQSDESVNAVLVGLPNAGKSSLFNRLIGQSRAIVTNIAGTTTDYVSGRIERGDRTIQLIDTAGIEDAFESAASDAAAISAAAQLLRDERTDRAQIRIDCLAANQSLLSSAHELIRDIQSTSDATASLVVLTQCDHACLPDVQVALDQFQTAGIIVIRTSSTTGEGIEELKNQLFTLASNLQTAESGVVASTILRTAESLEAAEKSVQLAQQAAEGQLGEELVAAEIRQALDGLGRVVGTIYTDDILDIVFGRFCIGK